MDSLKNLDRTVNICNQTECNLEDTSVDVGSRRLTIIKLFKIS